MDDLLKTTDVPAFQRLAEAQALPGWDELPLLLTIGTTPNDDGAEAPEGWRVLLERLQQGGSQVVLWQCVTLLEGLMLTYPQIRTLSVVWNAENDDGESIGTRLSWVCAHDDPSVSELQRFEWNALEDERPAPAWAQGDAGLPLKTGFALFQRFLDPSLGTLALDRVQEALDSRTSARPGAPRTREAALEALVRLRNERAAEVEAWVQNARLEHGTPDPLSSSTRRLRL